MVAVAGVFHGFTLNPRGPIASVTLHMIPTEDLTGLAEKTTAALRWLVSDTFTSWIPSGDMALASLAMRRGDPMRPSCSNSMTSHFLDALLLQHRLEHLARK